jgi:hypothetical protein
MALGGSAFAQNKFGATNGVDEVTMTGKQYFRFDETPTKYFWAVDLKIFDVTQKTTFQELVFKNDLLVACSIPNQDNIWYLSSYKTTDESLVVLELNKLINKAQNLGSNSNSQDKYQ